MHSLGGVQSPVYKRGGQLEIVKCHWNAFQQTPYWRTWEGISDAVGSDALDLDAVGQTSDLGGARPARTAAPETQVPSGL